MRHRIVLLLAVLIVFSSPALGDDSATVAFGKAGKPSFRFELKKLKGVWKITKQIDVRPGKKN
ncbi:MAG: hypothetical protein IID44_06140 [Planctomycetes bacterium]|nr:hypothetical protein [Planctomycetota bacterium]